MAKGSKPAPAIKSVATVVVEAYCPQCELSFPEALEVCPDDGARLIRLSQQQVALVGTTFDDRFEIHNLLGDGGMGAVYRARQLSTGREVAIKVIRSELTNDIKVAKRFLREARVSAGVAHKNTVEVYDYGQTDDGVLYLSMELLRGETLEDCVIKSGRMSPIRVARIVMQIFDALSAAHRQGVIHRDLKPSNIMVQTDETGKDLVKVLDFGLAKSLGSDFNTTAGFLMGTPAYLAPEIILRGDINFASDLYAVGVLMYEVLSGEVPFDDEDVPAVLMAHAHRKPPPLPDDIPKSMGDFVFQLLAKKPSDRFASAKAARKALQSAMADLTDENALDVAKTTEMAQLDADDLWGEDADEDAGTLRRPGPVADDATTSSNRMTAPRPAFKEARGKARNISPRGSFRPSRTKILTPVPALEHMRAEILEAVADDESVTREMVALLDGDTATDQLVAPEDDGDTDHHVLDPALVEALGETEEMDTHRRPSGVVPVPDPSEVATTKMPKQDRDALLAELGQHNPAYSTALVDRKDVRNLRRRPGSDGSHLQKPGPGRLFWVAFAAIGIGVGVAAWWFLGL